MSFFACQNDKYNINIDGILNIDHSEVLYNYGLGDVFLKKCENQLVRKGEFPLTVLAFDSSEPQIAKVDITFINKVPYQIVGVAWNYKKQGEFQLKDCVPGEDTVETSFYVDVKTGINILTISYLNSSKTPVQYNYNLGEERVNFIKLHIASAPTRTTGS